MPAGWGGGERAEGESGGAGQMCLFGKSRPPITNRPNSLAVRFFIRILSSICKAKFEIMKFDKLSVLLHIRIAILAIFFALVGYYFIFDSYTFTEMLGVYGLPAALIVSLGIDCGEAAKRDKE